VSANQCGASVWTSARALARALAGRTPCVRPRAEAAGTTRADWRSTTGPAPRPGAADDFDPVSGVERRGGRRRAQPRVQRRRDARAPRLGLRCGCAPRTRDPLPRHRPGSDAGEAGGSRSRPKRAAGNEGVRRRRERQRRRHAAPEVYRHLRPGAAAPAPAGANYTPGAPRAGEEDLFLTRALRDPPPEHCEAGPTRQSSGDLGVSASMARRSHDRLGAKAILDRFAVALPFARCAACMAFVCVSIKLYSGDTRPCPRAGLHAPHCARLTAKPRSKLAPGARKHGSTGWSAPGLSCPRPATTALRRSGLGDQGR